MIYASDEVAANFHCWTNSNIDCSGLWNISKTRLSEVFEVAQREFSLDESANLALAVADDTRLWGNARIAPN